jgi:acyl carrier protein
VKTTAEFELADQLIKQIRGNNNGRTSVNTEIEPDTDLLTTGILDSMGLVELLIFMESEYGYKIDLIDADPEQFSTIKGLCELASKSGS